MLIILFAITIVIAVTDMEAFIFNNLSAFALFCRGLGLVVPLLRQKAPPPTNVLSTESATVNAVQYGPEIIYIARVHRHRVVQ